MTGDEMSLRADGERVWVASATEGDIAAYARAVEQSRARLSAWNPVDPHGLPGQLLAQSASHQALLVHARDAVGDHDLVGKVTVSSVVRGRLLSGAVGYDAFDPYAGRGLFREGLRLAVDLVLSPEPRGMGLHRVEANVRPGNVRSAGLLRGLGFVREGFSPDFLILPDEHGQESWRDHDRYAVLSSEWPAAPYRVRPAARTAVLVTGVPGSGQTTLATALAAELGLPLFSKDAAQEAVADAWPTDPPAGHGQERSSSVGVAASNALWSLLAASPAGGVVEGWWGPNDTEYVVAGLTRAGFDPARVPEAWCELATAVAAERVEDAHRPPGIGPRFRVSTAGELSPRTVVELALRVRALAF